MITLFIHENLEFYLFIFNHSISYTQVQNFNHPPMIDHVEYYLKSVSNRGATRGVLGGARAPPDLFRVGPAIFANPLSFHFLTMGGGYPW